MTLEHMMRLIQSHELGICREGRCGRRCAHGRVRCRVHLAEHAARYRANRQRYVANRIATQLTTLVVEL